ncbi:MAG: UDP-3-O-(3-hydroxymyristoyl)glucosamine N-acyltransferase [Planctomycetota bacterium]
MTTKTLAELAALCGAELSGDPSRVVDGPASLSEAGARDVSFFAHPRYRGEFLATRAAAVLVPRGFSSPREDLSLLFCADPSASFTRVVGAFSAPEPLPRPGIHPTAVVDREARIAAGASIGPHCTVGPEARIGEGAILHASVSIGRGARIGARSVIHSGVVCYPEVRIGDGCILHAGAVIGSDGYGFEPSSDPAAPWRKIPQCGTVVVEDDVEIGANVTVDRGRFGATRIGRGSKIDNLVHIAHNVVIGDGALIIAQVGIAGSTRIGARAILAGQAGINGHLEIGAGARIAGQAGVFGDVPAGADYLGWPARPRAEALRQYALVQRLPEMHGRLKALEKRLAELEGRTS